MADRTLDRSYSERRTDTAQTPVILVLSIDLDGGRSDDLVMRFGDDAWAVALQFAVRNKLPRRAVDNLAQHMLQSLQQLAAKSAPSAPTAAVPSATLTAAPPPTSSAAPPVPASPAASRVSPPRRLASSSSSSSSSTSIFSQTNSASASSLCKADSSCSSPARRKVASPTRSRPKKGPHSPKATPNPRSARSPSSRRRRRWRSLPASFTGRPCIDENSRALANCGNVHPYPTVFDKLHLQGLAARRRKLQEMERIQQVRDARMRALAKPAVQMSETARNLVKNRSKGMLSADCPNYGIMLFQEAERRSRQRASDIQLAQDKQQREEMEGVTWKPEISNMAKKVSPLLPDGVPRYLRPRRPPKNPPKPEEYPYAPELDQRSLVIAKERRPRSNDIHESLFAEAEQRRWRSEDRRQQNELFEQQQLYTVWQQQTLGGLEDLSSQLGASLRIEDLLSGSSPLHSLVARTHIAPNTSQSAAPSHFRTPGHTSQLLDTCMTVASKKADAMVPKPAIPAPFKYEYDDPTTVLEKLYTFKPLSPI